MTQENDPPETTDLLVIDHDTVRFGTEVDGWEAVTFLAALTDDPADWDEVALVWPRCQNDLSVHSPDDLPIDTADLDQAISSLKNDRPWLAIDLLRKRILCGGGHTEIPRDTWCGVGDDDDEGAEYKHRVAIHLPPWWELTHGVEPNAIRRPREQSLKVPVSFRDILWGDQLARFLAQRMWQESETPNFFADKNDQSGNDFHQNTLAVHRDWLMTERDDLNGKTPRQCLFGGLRWIDSVVSIQRFAIANKCDPIPLDKELQTYKNGPFGREEICLYFDCCREMISKGWAWLEKKKQRLSQETGLTDLAVFLGNVRDVWLRRPFEMEIAPRKIIQVERLRIPRIMGGYPFLEDEDDDIILPDELMEMDGLDADDSELERNEESGIELAEETDGINIHGADCDCPICEMMGDLDLGPAFVGIDGHHLELDEEFAFSLCETREQWEEQQSEYQEFSDELDRKMTEAESSFSNQDEFASPWEHAHVNWESMQFGPMAHMAIGFLVADMVTSMHENDPESHDIKRLNDAFRVYRESEDVALATRQFNQTLESLAEEYGYLVSRSADLQSKLDELSRRMMD